MCVKGMSNEFHTSDSIVFGPMLMWMKDESMEQSLENAKVASDVFDLLIRHHEKVLVRPTTCQTKETSAMRTDWVEYSTAILFR